MGRLFWKFFAMLWLAQVLTSIGVGLIIWMSHPDLGPRHIGMPHPPMDFGAMPEGDHGPMPGGPPGMPPGFPPAHWGGPFPGGPGFAGGRIGPPDDSFWHPLPLWPPLVGAAVVSLVFAAWMARQFAGPVDRLAEAFDAVAAGRLDERIAASMRARKDEFSDLGEGFDRMAQRLTDMVNAHKRLLHDVSHELRSPLARLQAAADLLSQQPQRSGELRQRVDHEVGRIDALLEELLTLSRLDNLPASPGEVMDLAEVLEGVIEDARLEAQGHPCELVPPGFQSVPTFGHPRLLHRAIENVVRNAIAHSPPGGRVSFEVAISDGHWRLSILDEGSGVFHADLPKIFEPFFRSASRTNSSHGYGLGLAIAQRAVKAHGGSITAANRTPKGLSVTIDLPLHLAPIKQAT